MYTVHYNWVSLSMSVEVNVHRVFIVCANSMKEPIASHVHAYPLRMNINDARYVYMIIYNYTWCCMKLNMLWFQRAGRKKYNIMVR